MIEKTYLNGNNIRFEQNSLGLLTLYLSDGDVINNVKSKRLLPLTKKHSYISLSYENGEEIGILKDMEELEPKSRKLLEAKLEEYYVIPKIKKINDIVDKQGVARWDVETDIGKIEFDIRNRSADIKMLPQRRIILRDSDDNRYEIFDYTKLPRKSYLKIQGEI